MAVLLVAVLSIFFAVCPPHLQELAEVPSPQWVMMLGCLVFAFAWGVAAEVGVLLWRYRLRGPKRARFVAGTVLTNMISALLVGIPIFALLSSRILDSLPFRSIWIGTISLELLGVILLTSMLVPWCARKTEAASPKPGPQTFLTVVILNVSSGIVGLLAGKLFLVAFYPAVG